MADEKETVRDLTKITAADFLTQIVTDLQKLGADDHFYHAKLVLAGEEITFGIQILDDEYEDEPDVFDDLVNEQVH